MKTKLLSLAIALVAFTASGQLKPSYTDAEAANHIGEEATVSGKLVSVSTTATGTTFLNFGERFPRHTFGCVIFAGNQAAVGDVKPFEGKDVSVTGRIEAARDQKPQIIISRADQIQLAGAVPPAPKPAAVATAPMTAPTKSEPPTAPPAISESPSEKRSGKIELPSGWSSPRRGGDGVRKDLARLFGGAGVSSELATADTTFEVYPGVRFLTSLGDARKILNLDGLQSSKTRIATPGFPQDAFNANVFSGVFPGGFTRLSLVTDSSDQVVSVLLVDSSSRTRVLNETDTAGYHTYNFLTGGAKATNNLTIKHQISQIKGTTNVIVVDTLLVDPTDPEDVPPARTSRGITNKTSRPKTGKVLERSRWYVPAPIVNLILRCVGG